MISLGLSFRPESAVCHPDYEQIYLKLHTLGLIFATNFFTGGSHLAAKQEMSGWGCRLDGALQLRLQWAQMQSASAGDGPKPIRRAGRN
jgi:hypothetical protein